MNPAVAFHAGIAVLALVIVVGVARSSGMAAGFGAGSLGLILIGLGFYFFPLGAIEAYDATRNGFKLSESANSVLWYILSTALVVGGVLVVRWKSRKST